MKSLKQPFDICSVSRGDLDGLGFDVSKLDDGVMREIARKMEKAYVYEGFWEALEKIAPEMKIPKKQ